MCMCMWFEEYEAGGLQLLSKLEIDRLHAHAIRRLMFHARQENCLNAHADAREKTITALYSSKLKIFITELRLSILVYITT